MPLGNPANRTAASPLRSKTCDTHNCNHERSLVATTGGASTMDTIGPSETGLMWPEQVDVTVALYKFQSPRWPFTNMLPAGVTQCVLWTDAASIHGSWSKRAASGDRWWTERVNMDMQKPSKTGLGGTRDASTSTPPSAPEAGTTAAWEGAAAAARVLLLAAPMRKMRYA
ncbi:predicted protein [Pyrenophora tritici-repentis Pt-1C-BFP]|uniref:Uncharacterized protein n=1 Tax=Pyrenophora tritici-repentis (strain Pt-1C-BFP) TaxID=426418 RepID=B2WCF0_PYRTR|nr:uncharacterized protein PTRG_07659 [Pyrenophora tritici-repentis Pt-1C-BFP]EDU50578.1 predicted protein [Pyrenophora tritici-repentis Pt-1C-BFP]